MTRRLEYKNPYRHMKKIDNINRKARAGLVPTKKKGWGGGY